LARRQVRQSIVDGLRLRHHHGGIAAVLLVKIAEFVERGLLFAGQSSGCRIAFVS